MKIVYYQATQALANQINLNEEWPQGHTLGYRYHEKPTPSDETSFLHITDSLSLPWATDLYLN